MSAQVQPIHIWMVAAALLFSASAVAVPQLARAEAAGAPAGPRRALSARVDAGGSHTCAIRDDGAVLCWGYNGEGRLGVVGDDRGDNPGEMPPPRVPLGAGRTATAVTAGGSHTCVVRDNGTVICWGGNEAGQLGIGDTAARGALAGDLPTPTVNLGTGRTATAVAAGRLHTCALRDDGSVLCWGDNEYGQLGIGTTDDRGDGAGELPAPVDLGSGRSATAIVAGDLHTCALRDDGNVICWGANDAGMLGVGATDARGDGPNEMPTHAVPLGAGRTAIAIAAGERHTCALRDDRALVCWGDNDQGQLGVGDRERRGDDPGETLSTVALGEGRTALAVTGGSAHTCVIRDDGRVLCWGYNEGGQLGLGDTTDREVPTQPVPIAGERPVTTITSGNEQTCALRDNGTLVCWGQNGQGELGIGNTEVQGDEPDDLPTPAVPLGGRIRTPALRVANVGVAEGTGGTRSARFRITRSSVVGEVGVAYATVTGSATAANDYTMTTGRSTLASGVRGATVTVPVVTDADREPNETFRLRLSAPTGATIADANGTATIKNDDAAPRVSVSDAVIIEGDGGTRNVIVRVTLEHRSFEAITVDYTTFDGSATAPSDYVTRSGTVTIDPYTLSSSIGIAVRGDTRDEPHESFHLAATAVTNATPGDPLGTIGIVDDD